MPFIAHNQDWILGVGETETEAREHMIANHPDQTPVVAPATRAMVDSILNDPFTARDGRLLFEEIPASVPYIDGVACLSEEWAALTRADESMGFSSAAVRAEIDRLKPAQ